MIQLKRRRKREKKYRKGTESSRTGRDIFVIVGSFVPFFLRRVVSCIRFVFPPRSVFHLCALVWTSLCFVFHHFALHPAPVPLGSVSWHSFRTRPACCVRRLVTGNDERSAAIAFPSRFWPLCWRCELHDKVQVCARYCRSPYSLLFVFECCLPRAYMCARRILSNGLLCVVIMAGRNVFFSSINSSARNETAASYLAE